MRENRGPEARIAEGVRDLTRIAGRLPELVADMETIAGTARRGIRIDPETMAALRHLNNEDRRSLNWHIWLAAALLALVLLILR
jgi:ubiquinone biosynthesis protein